MSIEKYRKMVVPEHRRPKFLAWLLENLQRVDDSECLLLEIDPAFDIDKALGEQLDVTGTIVGRERQVNFEPPLGISPVLDDEMYRVLQKAKISINQWDGTLPSLWELWERLFPQYAFVMYDNQNMTLDLYIMGDTSIMERELFSRGYVAPKPEGVRIRYEFILPPVFLEREIYIGGNIAGDDNYINIPHKTLEDVNAPEGLVYVGAVIAADDSYIKLDDLIIKDLSMAGQIYPGTMAAENQLVNISTGDISIRSRFLSEFPGETLEGMKDKSLFRLSYIRKNK